MYYYALTVIIVIIIGRRRRRRRRRRRGEEEEYNSLVATVRPFPNSYILEDVHPPLQCELYTVLNNAKDVHPVPRFT